MGKSKKQTAPQPPAHLSVEAKKFWREINSLFVLEVQDQRRLEIACTSLDRAAQARSAIAKDGATFADRFGQIRPHPAVAIERDAAKLYLQAIRQMGVDVEGANSVGLPTASPLRLKA